ncbi:MAG TPA: anti-sigma factor [Puia sp.]|nr:anti-sigma factor [Puia sp.]
MNIQDYILSGIIESYVLGIASPEDRAEFESVCASHPEVRKARDEFEATLEAYFMNHPGTIKPASELRDKIFAEINRTADDSPKRETIIAPIYPLQPVKRGWWRFVAAAAIILLLGSTVLNYYFFTQYKEYSIKYQELSSSQIQMASANQALQTKLQDYESAMNLMKNPAMAIIKMNSVPSSPSPNSLATVYWDTRNKDVYLLANNLPATVTDKQYQLWAIVDGKPVDAGLVEIKEGLSFIKMKNIQRAQAFAITLEKKGGSDAPTPAAMYVLGKVTG